MSNPINHHYIPQFYMKYWTGNDGYLFRYHRPFDRVVVSKTPPKATGYEKNLYTINHEDDPQIVEKIFMSQLDNASANVIRVLNSDSRNFFIVDSDVLSIDQKTDFIRFVLSSHLRSPFSMTEVDSVFRKEVKINIDNNNRFMYSFDDSGRYVGSLYEYMLSVGSDPFADTHKLLLQEMINSQPLIRYMINMPWAVVDASGARHRFLTSDRPWIVPKGIKDPACIMGIPISPKKLFIASNNLKLLYQLNDQPREDTIRNANKIIVMMAVHNVYGSTDDRRQFVEKYLREKDKSPIPGIIVGKT